MPKASLRELLDAPGAARAVGAHDALGALLGERAGFDAIWSSGLEISTSQGVPDANILTMTEVLAAAAAMVRRLSIPVIADCDTGFGNSNNVIHMVQSFETAGVAAVCIEDKCFPKVNSFVPGRQELVPVAEFVGKIMAAKNAQRTSEFAVIARVEALVAGWGLDEALRRARAYVDAGADALVVHSKSTRPDEVLDFARSWCARVPLVLIPTTYFGIGVDELARAGANLVIYANHGMRAAIRAIESAYARILTSGSSAAIEGEIASVSQVLELGGMARMKAEERAFLRTEEPVRAVIPAAGDHGNVPSMREIAADVPMAMVDVHAKPILQRQVETLHRVGIEDIHVIAGYRGDQIEVEGVSIIASDAWREQGIAPSILSAGEPAGERTLVAFSDVLFDAELLRRLLDRSEDVVLAVDRRYNAARYDASRAADLAVLSDRPAPTRRTLDTTALSAVLRTGKQLHPVEAHTEFVGIALLSAKGFGWLREVYEEALERAPEAPFHEAPNVARASFTDAIQELIERGYPVHALELASGWMEIHSFDDYRDACAHFARCPGGDG